MQEWSVRVKGKVYTIKARTNAGARWKGARAYYFDNPTTNWTISMLYQVTSCYLVSGRKATPW